MSCFFIMLNLFTVSTLLFYINGFFLPSKLHMGCHNSCLSHLCCGCWIFKYFCFYVFNYRPAFIRIAGFHVSYDEFYESLMPRGEIGTKVMALWTYQYNLDEKDKWEKDRSRVKKFAFSTAVTVFSFLVFVYHSF